MDLVQAAGEAVDHRGELRSTRRDAVSLALALLALSLLDVVVTYFNIDHLGAVEMNPLVAPLIGSHWAIVLKAALPIGIVLMATRIHRHRAVRALRVAVAVYLVVAIIGFGQLAYALT